MGIILREFQKYEPFLGGTLIADVAILYDMWSKFDYHDNGKSVLDNSAHSIPHLDAVVSAARALKEKHIPYTVIANRNLKDAIGKYRVIVMPDILRLSDKAALEIRAFVKAGGKVYASGHTGLTNLGDVFGIEAAGETTQELTYMAPTDQGKEFFPDSSAKYPLAVNKAQQIVKPLPGAEVLATQVLPYTEKTGTAIFAAIHSNPPGKPTKDPSMIRNRFGQGTVFWAAGPIEGSNHNFQDKVFINCVEDLLDHKTALVFEAPPSVEAVCFSQDSGIIISVITTQTTLPPVTAHGLRMTVDLKGKSCAKVLHLPDQVETAFTESDGKVKFEIPPLELFHMFKVVYK
jgi:hypothetical protein